MGEILALKGGWLVRRPTKYDDLERKPKDEPAD